VLQPTEVAISVPRAVALGQRDRDVAAAVAVQRALQHAAARLFRVRVRVKVRARARARARARVRVRVRVRARVRVKIRVRVRVRVRARVRKYPWSTSRTGRSGPTRHEPESPRVGVDGQECVGECVGEWVSG
jgi:hypothetical protein